MRLRNPRPIPLDRDALGRLLDRLYRSLAEDAAQHGDLPVNDTATPVPIAQSSMRVTTTRGDAIDVMVLLTSARGSVGFINGGGKGTYDGKPVIFVEMNGRYPWSAIANEAVTRDRLSIVLAHEITHAMDVFNVKKSFRRRGGDVPGASTMSEEDMTDVSSYYNDPGEVAAWMREIHDGIRRSVVKLMRSPLADEWGLGGVVSRALNSNESWQRIAPHLTPRNRKRILSGLVRAFQDEGL
jgi:hypothetical protein